MMRVAGLARPDRSRAGNRRLFSLGEPRRPVAETESNLLRIASIKALPTTIGEIARVRVQRDMPVHRTEVFKRGMGYRESPGYPGGDDRTGLGLNPGNEKDGVVDADVGQSQSLSAGGANSS